MSSESGGNSLSEEEITEIETIEAILISLPKVSEMRKNLVFSDWVGFKEMQQQVCSFRKRLAKILKNISQPNSCKNMMILVSGELETFTSNILAIAAINETALSKLTSYLAAFIDHFKKYLSAYKNHFAEKIIESRQNMLESLRIIAKDCEIAVESAASWFSFLCMKSEALEVHFSDFALRLIQCRIDERSYLDCIDFTATLQNLQPVCQGIEKAAVCHRFLEYQKSMLQLAEICYNVSVAVSQCCHLHKWGIDTNSMYQDTINLSKFVEICFKLEFLLTRSDHKQAFDAFLQISHTCINKKILSAEISSQIVKIEKIISNPQVDLTKFYPLLKQLQMAVTQEIIPRFAPIFEDPSFVKMSIDNPGHPYIDNATTCMIKVIVKKCVDLFNTIKCYVNESKEYWLSGKKSSISFQQVMICSSDMLQRMRLEYKLSKIHTLEVKLQEILAVSKKDFAIDMYSLGHSCIHHLQVLHKFIKEEFVYYSDDLRNFSNEVEKFQMIATSVLKQLVKFVNSIAQEDKDFWLQLNCLQRNLVLCLSSHVYENGLDGSLKGIDACVANLCETLNSVISNDSKIYAKCSEDIPLITIQEDNLVRSHIFVNFEVIVRREDWKLKRSEQIKMGMSFLIPDLIKNLSLFLDFSPIRHVDECSIMSCGLAISKELCGKDLYYKYLLLSPFLSPAEILFIKKPVPEEVNYCFRVWKIPDCTSDLSELTVYDSCIYPQELAEQSIWGLFKSFITSSSTLKTPKLLQNEQQCCINAHLTGIYKIITQCQFSTEQDIMLAYKSIMAVFNSFQQAQKVNVSTTPPKKYAFFHDNCTQIFRDELMTLVETLNNTVLSKKIISGLILCRCLMEISKSYGCKSILSLLSVQYDQERKLCYEYDTVVSLLTLLRSKQPFIMSILTCIHGVLDNCNTKGQLIPWTSIIKSLPLYFWFVTFSQVPFCSLDMSKRSMDMTMGKIQDLNIFKSFNERDIKEILQHVKPIEFKGNCYLQLTLLQACRTCKEMPYLLILEHIAPPAIFWSLSMEIKNSSNIANQFTKISTIILAIAERKNTLPFNKYQENGIECLNFLINALGEKYRELYRFERPWREVSLKCFELILFMTSIGEYQQKFEALKSISPFITRWVSLSIGHKFANNNPNDSLKELKFWVDLYTIGGDSAEWISVLNPIVSERFKNVTPFGSQIKIFEQVKSVSKNSNSNVVNVIENVIDEKVTSASPEDVKELASGSITSKRFLGRLVDSKFPVMPTTFEEVLQWDMWPVVLTALVGVSDGVSMHCLSATHCIKELFEKLQEDIVSGDISVMQLQLLRKKWESHIIKILLSISLDQYYFQKCLKDSENNFAIFKFYFHLLKHFAETFAEKLQASEDLLKKLEQLDKQLSKMKVKCLCFRENESTWVFPEFQEVKSILPVLVPFAILTAQSLKNDISYNKFQQLSKHIKEDWSLEDVHHEVWYPLSTFCCNLVDNLESKAIKLDDLAKLFGSTDPADIEHTIRCLYHAIMRCRSYICDDIVSLATNFSLQFTESTANTLVSIVSIQLNCDWIKEISIQIDRWNLAHELSNEADQFIDILSTFGVNGEIFQRFSRQGIQVFLQSSLSSVTEEDETVLYFLKKSKAQTTEVKESIRNLGQCKDLRNWVRSKSEDVSEMERFIGIALDTVAGEGVDIQDRLVDLSELCARFSPLLYHLDDLNRPIVSILELFRQTWESLKTYDDPLTLVETCSSNLTWYQFVGKLQGAEQGTVKQLQEINKAGEYIIETTESSGCLVSLKIVSDDDQISKKDWTLEDLRELESKLILITRQSSSWKNEKECFQEMFLRVYQMSSAIHKLNIYGHMAFLKWSISLPCSKYLHELDSLDKMTHEFESILFNWIKYIWSCRYRYSELNYYATNQLILLRKELTFLMQNELYPIIPQVFHLLHSTAAKPVDSTVLLTKVLAQNLQEDDDIALPSQDQIMFEFSEQSFDDVQKNEKKTSKIVSSIEGLDDTQKKLFDELINCGYQDFLILEAILNQEISDIYNAMEWIDDCPNDELAKFESLWTELYNGGTKSSHDNVLKSPIQDSNSINILHQDEELDVTPIASSFFHMNERNLNRSLCVDEGDFMSMEDLGKCLKRIAKRRSGAMGGKVRMFSKPFEKGTPNLIVTASDNIFLCTLQIYAQDSETSLPSYDEILLCSESTTLEQIVIFWMRVLFNKESGRIYCLVHAEKLTYLIAEKAMDLLKYLSQGIQDYQLVIICSDEGEGKSTIVSRIHSYQRECSLPSEEDKEHIKQYLKQHFAQHTNIQDTSIVNASSVDQDNSRVRIVTSTQSGVGKSLYIRKMKDKLMKLLKQKEKHSSKAIITVPLHGPVVTSNEVLSMLLEDETDLKSCIVHLDIPQRVLKSIDNILFSIIILGGLSDTSGRIWRCHPSQLYALEVTVPGRETYMWGYTQTRRVMNLLQLLPNTQCFEPQKMLEMMDNNYKMAELRTPMYQRVYQYLQYFDSNDFLALEQFIFVGTLEGTDKDCLDTIIRHTSIPNPTWKEIRHFVWFLNVQLSACEQSNLIKRVKGLKRFTVEFMIMMSRDFATSSMPLEKKNDILEQHIPRNNWEESMHPYLFFNKDRTSITHVGLTFDSRYILYDAYTNKPLFTSLPKEVTQFLFHNVKIPIGFSSDIASNEQLVKRLLDFMNIKIEVGTGVVSPDVNYVLTHDNLTKIMAIQTRFRCQIPVVLMGETGCGKTHLIRYMCKIAAYEKHNKNMFILKVHGGTTENDVIKCLNDATKAALENRKLKIDTVVFFDEANTSDVISLIKEIMCDGRCKGKLVPPFLKFVAACNPYRKHSDEMIERLKCAGLGWREDASNASEKLGEIPLRDLVYRVLELPDSMKALVYDFGQLNKGTEEEYIKQMVLNKLRMFQFQQPAILPAIANVLAVCQDFMKMQKDECSFVSLRDVERALIIFVYFLETFTSFFNETGFQKIDQITQSLLLALSVSYLARMTSRGKFISLVVNTIKQSKPLSQITVKEYNQLLFQYQNSLLNCMEIEDNIAKNAALRENIFMMFVCIELRIPLFLVGKPGSSKSLAKTIIESSMKGKNSKKKTLKQFKQVHIHSHQCSPLSTPASITEVFINAKTFQDKKKDTTSFVSVVVLDEVGLAESSPYLPLKALHPLLEDGTEGSGSDDQRVSREERVAFIGISNWALDPAKMNRGIMVTRNDPTIEDLIESAKGICSNKGEQNDPVLARLEHYFPHLARSYIEINKLQRREFFGLRDFYSLIKMLYWMSERSGSILTRPQLEHAIRRNFSGFDEFDPVEIFESRLQEFKNVKSHMISSSNVLKQLRAKDVIMLKCETTDEYLVINEKDELHCSSNNTRDAQFIVHIENKTIAFQSAYANNVWIGTQSVNGDVVLVAQKDKTQFNILETRNQTSIQICPHRHHSSIAHIYGKKEFSLLVSDDTLMSPDCTPLGLIKESLTNREITYHGESRYLLFLTDNYSSLQVLKHYIVTSSCLQTSNSSNAQAMEPYVLFGSSFPKDSEFAQVCQNISEIRLCMETGRMVILLNLENLYESLYDVLNQYYIKSGGHRYVDLGLRTNRMKCTVHQQFKLVLIAEKDKVYDKFPIPLINRLEKHFVNTETVLKDWQRPVCSDLGNWVHSFDDSNNGFDKKDAFIGYSEDTKAAVVLQASILVQNNNPEYSEDSPAWKEQVFKMSEWLLLQIASPDAIMRRVASDKDNSHLQDIYFIQQEHSSLADLISRIEPSYRNTLLLQVTTHASTLSQDEVHTLAEKIGLTHEQVNRVHLEAFQTEQDFLSSIDIALEKGLSHDYLMIFECESGHENGNLISCCRYRLVDKLAEADQSSSTSFVLLIHLPKKCSKSNFVSFQEQPWLCYHVDDILPSISLADLVCREGQLISEFYFHEESKVPEISMVQQSTMDVCINEPFKLKPISSFGSSNILNLCKRMHLYICDAVSQSPYQNEPGRLERLMKVIPKDPSSLIPDEPSFFLLTVKIIKRILQKNTFHSQEWIIDEATNLQRLQEAGTFLNALIRKFDKLVIPVLGNIVSFADRNCNLELLIQGDPDITKLWLDIYSLPHLSQHLFETVGSLEEETIVTKNTFRCQFPFSFFFFKIIKDREETSPDFHAVLAALVNTDLSHCFNSLSNSTIGRLAECYIHDFVHIVFPELQSQNDSYYEILHECIQNMAIEEIGNIHQAMLLQTIAAIHQSYFENKSYFNMFSDLVSQMPSIIIDLKKNFMSSPEIKILVVETVKEVLNSHYFDVKAPLYNGSGALKGWIQKLYELHEPISEVVNKLQDHIPGPLLLKWHWICVMKMFFEYVVLNNEKELIFFARRIEKYMEKGDEFQTPNTLRTVAVLLNSVEKGLQKLPRNQQDPIRKSCWSFFLDLLSIVCVDVNEELIDVLIDSVFFVPGEPPKDEKLAAFVQNHLEYLSYLQSFVMKLILCQEFSTSNNALVKIFDRISRWDNTPIKEHDFLTLATNNFKTQICHGCYDEIGNAKISFVTDEWLRKGQNDLLTCGNEPTSSKYLRAVAQIKLSVHVLANTLKSFVIQPVELEINGDEDVHYFFHEAEMYLQNDSLNEEQTCDGPLWYLVRYIIRTFGVSTLFKIFNDDTFNGVLPYDIFPKEPFMDQGAVYNPVYENIRSAIIRATKGDFDELAKQIESLRVSNIIPLTLALWERVRLSYVSDLPSKQLSSETIEHLTGFVQKCKLFHNNSEILRIVEALLQNKQCQRFHAMQAREEDTAEDTTYRMIVIHSVITVLANRRTTLKFFSNLIISPEVLKNCLLPAMPIQAQSSKKIVEEEGFPECIQGHQYTFEMIESPCPQCGNIINKCDDKTTRSTKYPDILQFGYVPLTSREKNVPLGKVPAVSSVIIRCIIHSCLLWAACSGKNVNQLLHGKIPMDDLPMYFWKQLQDDIAQLSKATGRSIDEVALLFHSVLREINQKGEEIQILQSKAIKYDKLTSYDQCTEWEQHFHENYVKPIFEEPDSAINQIVKLLSTKDHNQLFAATYIAPLNGELFLWQVHPEPSIEQFRYMFFNLKLAETNPVLYMFLSEMHSLEATQMIPDILNMQKMIQGLINKQLDVQKRSVIENMTFSNFLDQANLDAKSNEHCHQLLTSLQKAWNLCRCELYDYDRLKAMKKEYLQEDITEDTLMKFIIPTTDGPGMITTALMDHLIITHNRFIRQCREFVEKSLKRKWLWKSPEVGLLKLDQSHLICCTNEFIKLLHVHSTYTVSSGNVKIEYNLDGLERDLVQRFVLGKHIITHTLEIPQVTWQSQIYNTQTIALVKKNIPQQPLPSQAKPEILTELKTISDITKVCDLVETVMRFLQTKEDPKRKIRNYIEVELQMSGKLRNKKIADYCCLEHIVSLWKLLNIEQAKIKVRNKMNPFPVLRPEFNNTLKTKKSQDQRLSLEKAVNKMSFLDNLLEVMYEFIQTYVHLCDVNEAKLPLKDVLLQFAKQIKSESITDSLDLLPPDITLGQVAATWKQIVCLQDDIKKTRH